MTAFSLLILGCSSSAPAPTSTIDGKADSLTADAALGEHCGGFVAHPKKCAAGLVCVANHHIPDAPGVCQEAQNQCTGLLPQFCEVCADGTTQCAHWDDQCNVVTCPKKQGGQEGDACNDFARCADGLVCTGSNGGPGVCQKSA
jgi:hypothetical protein